jgi:GT2 family glycosyltransferase
MTDEESRPGPQPDRGRNAPANDIAELEARARRLEEAVRDRTAALVEARESIRQTRLSAEKAELELRRELDATRARVARLTGNPAFRLALAGLRAVRRVRGAISAKSPIGRGGASRGAERDVTRRLLAQLPDEAPTTGPRVAIVILNHDGVDHLRRLLPALESTAYRDFEIVLVDNASSDGSVAYARGFQTNHPLKIVENAENLSFSVANNLALGHTDAELLLLLNNDVRPMEPHWLGWMVGSVMTDGTVACGARLIVPRRRIARSERTRVLGDLELQHAGIQFSWIMGMPRPWNIGGPDASAPEFVGVHERAAATAACLLIRRDAFVAAGGFDPAYVYGYEDVDLCLRLRAAGGRILVDGRAVLWHDESSTRRRDASRDELLRQRQNRQTFHGRWGSSLFRDVLRDRLDGRGFLSADPLGCAVAVPAEAMGGAGPPAREKALLDALIRMGWAARTVVTGSPDWPGTPDIVVVTDPRVDVRELSRDALKVGWIAESVDRWVGTPWIDDYDLLLASDVTALDVIRDSTSHIARLIPPADGPIEAIAQAIKAELRAWVDARRVGILIQADDWERASTSGDYHFARALQRQFERRGMPTTVYFRPAWATPVSTRDDVAIHLWGRYSLGRRPGQTTILWILYHPELVTDELLAAYDLVLAASDRFARAIADRSPAPVASLHQAADPERFRPGLPGPHHDLIFVGNSRGVRRPILDDLTPTTLDLAVYGGGWPPDLLDPAYLRGSSVANEELPGYYASAAIVLNDHWQEAGEAGFLNNRLYDALAAGGFVISDEVDGLREEFDDAVVSYRDAADLIQLVDRYLADPAARAERAEKGRRAILERHTFSHRVDEILRLIEPLPPPRPEVISTSGPKAPAARRDHGVRELIRTGPRASRMTERRLNLVVPTLDPAAAFGGVRTAIDLYRETALDQARRRIISLRPFDLAAEEAFPGYRRVDPVDDPLDRLQLVAVAPDRDATLPVGRGDVFMATFWSTAELVGRFRRWQAMTYGAAPPHWVYLIQDFEPAFYPWSAPFLLARATYDEPESTLAVFNTSLLRDFVHQMGIRFANEFVFEPRLSPRLRQIRDRKPEARDRRIVVYGRPGTPRNAFPLIVEGLRAWQAMHPGAADWSVVSAGQDHPDVDLGGGSLMRSVGKLEIGAYGDLLKRSAIGLSLMVSPHPSYPPLEMAHLGMLVLTNRFDGKDLATWHTNIVSLGQETSEGIGQELAALCRRIELDPQAGERGTSRRPDFLGDDPQFPFAAELAALLRSDPA